MRIGEFSKKYGVTIDTIRHYMDLELLLPDKKGGHYYFGEEEINDIDKVLELKELKFTLSEIQKLTVYSRLSRLRSKEDKDYIKKIFLNKQATLEKEKKEIKNALNILKHKINEINDKDNIVNSEYTDEHRIGMPISFLQNLNCPVCNNILELEDGKITKNMLMEGYFKCDCGYSGDVKNGIYISLDEEDKKKIPIQNLDSEADQTIALTLGEYVEETAPSFVNHIYKSIDAIINFMQVENIDNKIILELGTGFGFFIRRFLSYIKPSNIYIITDHDISRINEIKTYLQKHSPNGKFVFICTDLSKLPIKNEIVDYTINYATSLTYHLNDDRMLDSLIIPKIKRGGKLIGSYSYVKSGSRLLLSVPETSRKYYEEKALKTEINKLPLKLIKIKNMNSIEEVESKYEQLMKGTKLHALIYCGEK